MTGMCCRRSVDIPGIWHLISSKSEGEDAASITVDDPYLAGRLRRRARFAPTWLGAIGVVVLSVSVDLLMVIGAVVREIEPCGGSSTVRGLIVSSLVVMGLAALPATRWLAWFVRHDERRVQAVLAFAVVGAGIALTVLAQIAITSPSPNPLVCD
jgi:hypothetical protein